jgi:hypothetical protein
MTERGKDHLGALCVVAACLAERAWTVMRRGAPHVIRDTDGRPVTAAQATAIIAERWTVPPEIRARRRNKKTGKAPRKSSKDSAYGAAFPAAPLHSVKDSPSRQLLDKRSSIGNQITSFGAQHRWPHRRPDCRAEHFLQDWFEREVLRRGTSTRLSSGDPQEPSRRLVASCRWSRSWPCAELTANRVSCRRTAGPGLAARRGNADRDVRSGSPGALLRPGPPSKSS